MQDFTFRIAGPTDVETIRQIVMAAYAKWVPLINREPLPMVADYGEAIRMHRFDLLELDGKIVGLIETSPKEDHVWIENIAVRPDQQRNGFGKALIAKAEQLAMDANLSELRLLTNAAFESNIQLYEKTGFAVDRKVPFMGGITVYMSKRLK
jgi:GNAT superfamily N-acetyltransferase